VAGVEGDLAASGAARGRALAVAGVAGFAGLVGLWTALRPPRVKRIEIELLRWPRGLDGFRLVQISDIHVGPILGRPFAEDLVTRVNALGPDLIAVTGDLVDGSVAKLADEVAPFARLRAPHGVYFVTGNHDYFSGADEWAGLVASMGIRVLRNERVQIGAGADAFDLAGVEDHHAHWVTGGPGEDLPRALDGRDPSRCVVLLAHDPGSFREAAELGVDLQLSGHTHGGQIWPFMYLVRIFVRHVAGLYRVGASQLYVSRGTGFWGPPMRLFAPAEITEIALRSPRR
jgi:predicted MPP superfamily phosphohydrolase